MYLYLNNRIIVSAMVVVVVVVVMVVVETWACLFVKIKCWLQKPHINNNKTAFFVLYTKIVAGWRALIKKIRSFYCFVRYFN